MSQSMEVQINISELILTPFTGASLVNEILKGLIYQKCQIPYPYSWLKSVVEKRRKKIDSADHVPKKINFTHENHFRTVSSTYDTLDSIMKGITKEFCTDNNRINEVVMLFGSTPGSPKEVFTIAMSSTVKGHIERNHVGQLNKHIQKVLRKIFLSQTWMDSIDASILCTNTYIYLKKVTAVETNYLNEVFERCEPLNISQSTKHTKFILSNVLDLSDRTNCCESLVIFDENGGYSKVPNKEEILKANESVVWYRSKSFLKGFKDCFVDKVSVCELW